MNTSGDWGTSADIFFGSEKEKYLGFGNLVQLTHTTLNPEGGNSGMKLHRNMELVDIILSGSVGFQDSFGGTSTFPGNTLQTISAGKGIYQLEFNAGESIAEKLQIGFLPSSLNKNPLKSKALYDLEQHKNALVELVSPHNPSSLTLRQQAAVFLGTFDAEKHVGYRVNDPSVGLFIFVIKGVMTVHNHILRRGDSIGIQEDEQIMLHTAEESTVLLIETSMND
ncbi:MAG: pirin family protein [Bacteroidota bacterium]